MFNGVWLIYRKRGRGRPRKYPIGESPAEKRERDRANGIRRGRGRPRKNPLDRVEKPSSGSSVEQKVENMHKAGIAAGMSSAQTPNPTDGSSNSLKPKRGRGRPPKHKKEPQVDLEEKKITGIDDEKVPASVPQDNTATTATATATGKEVTSDEDSNTNSSSPPPESLNVVVDKSNDNATSDSHNG